MKEEKKRPSKWASGHWNLEEQNGGAGKGRFLEGLQNYLGTEPPYWSVDVSKISDGFFLLRFLPVFGSSYIICMLRLPR
jgi:hypothetical protein